MDLRLNFNSRKLFVCLLAIACFESPAHATILKPPSTLVPGVATAREADRAENLRQLRLALAREEAERPRQVGAPNSGHTPRPMTTVELKQRYAFELKREIRKRWSSQSAPHLVKCKLRFEQVPGGLVTLIEFVDCPYSAAARSAVERALRFRELPYAGFEPVFSRDVTMTLCVPEQECTAKDSLR